MCTQIWPKFCQNWNWTDFQTRKPRKGAAVIAASMHGFASCRKFKSPVTFTLTLDRVKVTSTYASDSVCLLTLRAL